MGREVATLLAVTNRVAATERDESKAPTDDPRCRRRGLPAPYHLAALCSTPCSTAPSLSVAPLRGPLVLAPLTGLVGDFQPRGSTAYVDK